MMLYFVLMFGVVRGSVPLQQFRQPTRAYASVELVCYEDAEDDEEDE